MFYSQFILAKKGPLGTIWIAAHLERKLRKNQVADTDIGVSVDSILFPEVPIALRLSSHLLLGVVRIYSRKVNYLFNDCSEALLKIKQAFRSTAVDLPPEESTAPYHSITLPETFDLDDFELPDNVSIHANFDHHVSTREQITLQDTVEDVGYLTSQFGLDERFGDGDSSQIVLDFDEDLFSSKTRSPVHTSILLGTEADEDPQASGQPSTSANNMDIDEYPNTSVVDRSSEHMPELNTGSCVNHIELNTQDPARADGFSVLPGDHVQTPDLNDVVFPCTPFQGTSADLDMMDIACPSVHGSSTDVNEECSPFATAQAPSTPGLMEEAIPASVQGVPALSHLKKPSVSSPVEVPVPGVPCNSLLDPDVQILTHSAVNENLRNPIDEQDLRIVNTCEPVDSSLNEKISDFSTDFQPIPEGNMELDRVLPVDNIDSQASEIQDLVGSAGDSSLLELRNVEPKDCSVAQHFEVLSPAGPDGNACPHIHVLQPCSTTIKQSTLLTPQDGLTEGNAMDCSVAQHFEVLNPVGLDENACPRIHVLQSCSTTLKQSTLLTPQDGHTEGNAMDCSVAQHFEVLNPVGLDGNACPHIHVLQPCSTTPKQSTLLTLQDGLTEGNATDCSVAQHFEVLNPVGLDGNACQPSSTMLKQSTLLTPQDGLTEGNATDCSVAQHFEVLNPVGLDGNACPRIHVLQPCSTTLKQSTLLTPQDRLTEGNATDCSVAQHFEVLNPVGLDGNACQPSSTMLKQSTLLTPQDGLTKGNATDCSVAQHFEVLNAVGLDGNACPRIHVLQPCSTTLKQSTLLTPQDGLTEGNASDLPSREGGFCTLEVPGTVGPQDGQTERNTSDLPREVGFCTLEAAGTEGPQDGLTEGNALDLPSREMAFCSSEAAGTEGPLECGGVPVGEVGFCTLEAPGTEGPQDGLTEGNVPDFPSREVGLYALEVPETEGPLECGGQPMSVKMQGEGHPTKVTEVTLISQQKLEPVRPDTLGVHNKIYECLDAVFSSNAETGTLPPPETLLLTPTVGPDLPDDLVMKQSGVEKEAAVDFEQSIDIGKNISGKKRSLMESTPVLQNGNPSKFSGFFHSKRSADFVPDDDDILASILVGRRTPVFNLRPTPPPEIVSLKRRRMTTKLSVHKRKVLLDETMILHSDAIRAQLTNTEDIRRVRRKAPCNPPEIWLIKKYSLEDRFLEEPLLTGMSSELADLYSQTWGITGIEVAHIGVSNTLFELSKELEFRRGVEHTKETSLNGVGGLFGRIPETDNVQIQESTDTFIRIQNDGSKNPVVSFAGHDTSKNPVVSLTGHTQETVDILTDTALSDPSEIGKQVKLVSAEIIMDSNKDGNLTSHATGIESEVPNFTPENYSNGSSAFRIESSPTARAEGMPECVVRSLFCSDQNLGLQTLGVVGEPTDETLLLTESTPLDASSDKVENKVVNDETSVLSDSTLKFHEASHLGGQVSTNDEIVVPVPGNLSFETGRDGALKFHEESHLEGQVSTNDEIVVPVPGNFSLETGADVLADSSGSHVNLNPNLNLTVESRPQTDLAIVYNDPVIGGTGSESKVVAEVGILNPNLNDEIVINVPGNFSLETGADVLVDSSGPQGNLNPNLNLTVESVRKIDLAIVHDDPVIGGTGSESKVVAGVGILDPNLNDEIVIPVPGNFSLETGADVVVDSSGPQGNLNPNLNLTVESMQKIDLAVVHDDPAIGGTGSESKIVAEVGILNPNLDDKIEITVPGNFSLETGADVVVDSSGPHGNLNPNLNLTMESLQKIDLAIVHDDPVIGETRSESKVVAKVGILAENVRVDQHALDPEGNPSTDSICTNEPVLASSLELNADSGSIPKYYLGENPGHQEVNLEVADDGENTGMDIDTVNDSAVDHLQDYGHTSDGNNTEFLNMDDEVEHEEDADNITSEEARFLENSGWSSRTRAVARYLQCLFDNKDVPGSQRILHMDRLLVGKSRKEASRMFFETLVLKTREYIHVEQENPFANIHIHPTQKLTKSEF